MSIAHTWTCGRQWLQYWQLSLLSSVRAKFLHASITLLNHINSYSDETAECMSVSLRDGASSLRVERLRSSALKAWDFSAEVWMFPGFFLMIAQSEKVGEKFTVTVLVRVSTQHLIDKVPPSLHVTPGTLPRSHSKLQPGLTEHVSWLIFNYWCPAYNLERVKCVVHFIGHVQVLSSSYWLWCDQGYSFTFQQEDLTNGKKCLKKINQITERARLCLYWGPSPWKALEKPFCLPQILCAESTHWWLSAQGGVGCHEKHLQVDWKICNAQNMGGCLLGLLTKPFRK